MLYNDVMHPINLARLLYDVLAVTVRSFSPETLVRKRVKRSSRGSEVEQQPHHRGRSHHRSSRPSSRTASANTSLNASALVSGELPPQVPHRHRSSSGGSRRSNREKRSNKEGAKSWKDWRSFDVTKQAVLLLHVLRSTPVMLLHFLCQLKTDAVTLPLLRFRDLSGTAKRLVCLNEAALFAPDFVLAFVVTRVLLSVGKHYLMERAFLETNLVVRSLRSRRTWRNVSAWAMTLTSHTVTDPVAFSVLTPVLLNRVRDLSPVTGPLRYTPAGVCRGVAVGFAGVVLEMLVVPLASQMCQRAVVRIVDGTEYVLLRRYARRALLHGAGSTTNSRNVSEMGDHEDHNIDDDNGDGRDPNSSRLSAHSHRSTVPARGDNDTSNISTSSKAERALQKHGSRTATAGAAATAKTKMSEEDRERRRRRAEKQEAERAAEAEHRLIMRALMYRVAAALIAQCLVQHPLTVLAHMLYSRAVLHATGLLEEYDDAPAVPLTWRLFLQLLRRSSDAGVKQSSGVPAVEVLRSIGAFIGHEVSMVGSSIRGCSAQDAAIRELVQRAEQNRSSSSSSSSSDNNMDVGGFGSRASALESAELMVRSTASLSPLFWAMHFTAIDKLLGFYMAVWVRLRRE
ncbi:hypothetical protein DQ04_02531070 [Trypanosoma grayi]|uniref:hypothetical protein n=1 Tax=Trypanosoma grayi TaxID=71804 RepID=UPI0004F44F6B|nr:hypothetical protein DQ04_02531070 [Trypanosoma grayi]KEG11531.1 hypothetical protein DQ04_02531070 [Trypanosoma grayi]